MLRQASEQFEIDMTVPFNELSKIDRDLILYGSGDREFHFSYKNNYGKVRDSVMPFEGVINNISRRYHSTSSDYTRRVMGEYMTELPCPVCDGKRLNREALSVKVNQLDIADISNFSVGEALAFFDQLTLSESNQMIAET